MLHLQSTGEEFTQHPQWNAVARLGSDNTADENCFLPSQGQLQQCHMILQVSAGEYEKPTNLLEVASSKKDHVPVPL
jgi:hypothetical protein